MPPDRGRRLNPQGRQKSCSECAKAKRRCDLQQPHCIRCTRQKLTCTYPPHPYSSSTVTPASQPDTPEIFDNVNTPGIAAWPGIDIPSLPTAIDTDFLDFDLNPPHTCYDLEVDVEGRTITSAQSPHVIPQFSQKALSAFMLSPFSDARVAYSLEQWKMTPEMMVKENCTHWCHAKLYDDYMPQQLQDAYASCALAITRNDTNATFIARHVTERAYELIEQPTPTPPLEILARAHALLLYQIILICSGDVRYFGQVETLIPHLENITTAVQALTSRDDELNKTIPLYPSSVSRDAWTSFIFRESCRRTLLAVVQASTTGRLLRGQYVTCASHLAVDNRFTVSTALWNAKSPLEFAMAWNEKNHFLIKELDFKEMLRDARADDVDGFGRMMLIGVMGVDDVKAWLHTRGGHL